MTDTSSAPNHSKEGHAELLDGIYRLQRHIYDLTRKYFLFGRDTLITQMLANTSQSGTSQSGAPKSVLEVGCGTGRNLRLIEKKLPNAQFFGLDASREMLQQAQKKLRQDASDIRLEFGYAESFSGTELFQQPTFDRIVFSYSLSMIPDWKGALENGLKHIPSDGAIWIVDFWDQAGYPTWFQRLLVKWLDLFHVRFEPALLEYLQGLEAEGQYTVRLEPVGRRYSYIAEIRPQASKE